MAVRVAVERTVDASAAQVFAVLADPSSYARWVCGTREIRWADADWPRVGARLGHRFGFWPLRSRGVSEVVGCEPPVTLVLHADVAPLAQVRATMTLTPDGGRTRVRLREDMTSGAVLRFGPLATAVQRWRNRSSLRRLARLAVDRAPPPVPVRAVTGPARRPARGTPPAEPPPRARSAGAGPEPHSR